jgi:hypothetical protein
MREDPIVEGVRKVREEHAARFNYDLEAICRDLKEQEKAGGRKVVSLAPKRPEHATKTQ